MPNVALDAFKEDEGRIKALSNISVELRRLGVPLVLHELAAQNLIRMANVDAGYKHAWREGYVAAMNDILFFQESYVDTNKPSAPPRTNFGALPALVSSKEISPAEAEYVRNNGQSKPPVTAAFNSKQQG